MAGHEEHYGEEPPKGHKDELVHGPEEPGERRRERPDRDLVRDERRYREEPERGRGGELDRRFKEDDRRRDRRRGDDRDRDRDRERDRDRDRDRRRGSHEKPRSRSRSRDKRRKSHDASRSRSRSKEKAEKAERTDRRKRQSGFDMAPPGAVNPVNIPGLMNPSGSAGMSNQASMFSSMVSMMSTQAEGSGLSMLGNVSLPSLSEKITQATRHARRVYVGGLPPMASEQNVAAFFSQAMQVIGGNTAGPGDAAVNVYINQEKRFAFVELRTVEEASNAMALDGIVYEGVSLRVRRPSDYNPALAATLGPSQPSPHLNLTSVGLTPGSAGGADGPDRIFVGGLPYYLTEEQIRELLSAFGPLRAFDLVKDRDTGNSKGYGFCVYQDTNVTDIACAALNGMKMGDKVLTVRRATAGATQSKPEQASVLAQAQQQIAMQTMAMSATGANSMPLGVPSGYPGSLSESQMSLEIPTRVLCLAQVVAPSELSSEEDYEEIMEDMKEECGKFGEVANLVIPRPGPSGEMLPGVGKVFVEYSEIVGAQRAKLSLQGRKFGGNAVVALFYSEDRFARGDFTG